ncbi:MAG: ribosome small subunit-dependent GTPase A [Lachnospiraceae bacterium]
MNGKIIKGIAGFYYVYVSEKGIYECKAKGVFRNQSIKPLVGDHVSLDILDEKEKKGNINTILKRKNELIRPAVANVDQSMIIFALAMPEPNFNLLDRFLIMMDQKDIPCIICFNKSDLITEEKKEEIREIYKNSGCQVIFSSAQSEHGLEEIKETLEGKVTTVAGPSGVGKSSLINLLQSNVNMETGNISEKIERGKHTTRHSELITINDHTFIFDTPGFSSLMVGKMEKEELKYAYHEFLAYLDQCKYKSCTHIHEPECVVKDAVEKNKIHNIRYENYKKIFEEIKESKRY